MLNNSERIRRGDPSRRRCFLLTGPLSLLLFFCVFAGPAVAGNFLWEVKSPTATVYLFGSIHYAKPDMYPLDAVIEDAFARSRNLVLEINPLAIDQEDLLRKILTQGMYTGDRTLRDDLDEETFALLRDYLQKAGQPVEAFLKMKPAVLLLTLSSLEMKRLGYDPEQGIDIYFARKAGNSKPILELESVTDQWSMLTHLPDANLMLRYTIHEISNTSEEISKIVDFWKTGNTSGLEAVTMDSRVLGDARMRPILNAVLFERNAKMTETIKTYLASDDTYFLVVGAAHFVGEQGIVRLLEKAGFTVRQF